MNETSTTPTVAEYDAKQTGQLIRKALRKNFPGVKFSVRMDRGTSWGSYTVAWTDGPRAADVEEVINVFQGCDFDGMDDSTTHRGFVQFEGGLARFGARYVSASRTISADFAAIVAVDVIEQDLWDWHDVPFSALKCEADKRNCINYHARQRSA